MRLDGKLFLGSILLISISAIAQNKEKIRERNIKEVVITGQISPQSVKESIKNVRVITAQDIKNMGAVNLDDALNQYINITVLPDVNSGRSTVSLFGLDSSYFKIFIDNIPFVSEGGVGNNTDLSQININDIERVEIIEGSMGVTHGANAVSGILNIITKKKAQSRYEISASVQEESMGNEYNLKDKGRHIQSLKVNYNINDNWMFSTGFNRNQSNGYFGNYKGKNYLLPDGRRGYKFLPRDYTQENALISYRKGSFKSFYKFEYMETNFNFFDRNSKSGYNDEIGAYRYGTDKKYYYSRNAHHLNANGRFNDFAYNISASYQYQEREIERFRYIINTRQSINRERKKDQSMDVIYSTGTLNKSFADKRYNIQLGYELVNNKGFSEVDDAGHTIKQINKKIDNYDVFALSEIGFTKNFSIRPGFRYSFQTLFNNQYSYSLGLRYLLNDYEFRASGGKSYRTPSFDELYTYNVFEGHSFLGNENLIPENGFSTEASIKKTTELNNGKSRLHNQVMFSTNNISDKIYNALLDLDGNAPKFQYINISKYKSYHISTSNNFKSDNWDFGLGASFAWVSQKVESEKHHTDDRFLLNINANLNLSYNIPQWDTRISAYYKFIGKSQQWTVSTKGYVISEQDPYGWLDMSLQKKFFKKNVEVAFGARNLLNTTDIKRTTTSADGSSRNVQSVALGYGRSFYLKLTYNLNIKQ